MSSAIRALIRSGVRMLSTLFGLLRYRRLPRSTAFEVDGSHVSSRNVNAFSSVGEKSFLSVSPSCLNRWRRRLSLASVARAVWVRQRRSNKG